MVKVLLLESCEYGEYKEKVSLPPDVAAKLIKEGKAKEIPYY